MSLSFLDGLHREVKRYTRGWQVDNQEILVGEIPYYGHRVPVGQYLHVIERENMRIALPFAVAFNRKLNLLLFKERESQ